MNGIGINLDGQFADFALGFRPVKLVELTQGETFQVALRENVTAAGKPGVAVRLDLPDGTVAIAHTTLALFLSAGDAMKTKAGDPRLGTYTPALEPTVFKHVEKGGMYAFIGWIPNKTDDTQLVWYVDMATHEPFVRTPEDFAARFVALDAQTVRDELLRGHLERSLAKKEDADGVDPAPHS